MIDTGLITSLITQDNWLFDKGKGLKAIQFDGQWDNFLPTEEIQNNYGFDPCSCTSYGTINAIEILLRQRGVIDEYSERFLAIASNTVPPGNDPHKVCETIRKVGLVSENSLPWQSAKTIEEYYTPNPLTHELRDEADLWLEKYTFQHRWVFDPKDTIDSKITKIKEALKYSPVAVSVFAWLKQGGIYIKPQGVTDSHWCVIYGYNEDGTWKCFDSLDYSRKTLDKYYNFTQGKMFSIFPTVKKSFLSNIIDIIKQICVR